MAYINGKETFLATVVKTIENPETKERLDNHEKRITNLEKGKSDDLFVTDESVAYIKTVPTNTCPYAAVEKVGGKTSECTNLLPYPYADSTATINGMAFTDNGDGTITIGGATTSEKAVFRLVNDLRLPTGTYCFALREESAADGVLLSVMKNGKWVFDTAGKNTVDVASGDVIRVYLQVAGNKTINNAIVTPRINAGETVLPFEKYYEGTQHAKVTAIESKDANGSVIGRIDIPTEVQSIEGYGEGAGTASNAIVWHEDGILFEKKCAKINLTADMAIYRDAYAPNFRLGFNIADKAPSVGFVGNMASNIAVLVDPITTPATAKEYSIAGSSSAGSVYVIVPNITSTADAIAYLNEHPIELWYETTNPDSTDISDLITADNLIEVESGGTLTFVSEHGCSVPSSVTYQLKEVSE